MRDPEPAGDTTQLLARLSQGDAPAADLLLPHVYDELRRLAGRLFRQGHHTLQPTALVHEAYLRLVQNQEIDWESRAHFYAVSARAMRMILTDHARRRGALKRGEGDRERLTLVGEVADDEREIDLLAIDDALEKLAGLNAAHARIVECRFFSGLTVPEVAHVLGCSVSKIESEWRVIRAWLGRELAGA